MAACGHLNNTNARYVNHRLGEMSYRVVVTVAEVIRRKTERTCFRDTLPYFQFNSSNGAIRCSERVLSAMLTVHVKC